MGRKNRPFYRIEVFDAHKQRDGISIENVGHYDPYIADNDAKVTIREKRMKHWLDQGAEVSKTVREFLIARGLIEPPKGRPKKTEKEREKRKKRRKVTGRCKSNRRIKMLAAKEKAKNKPAPKPEAVAEEKE